MDGLHNGHKKEKLMICEERVNSAETRQSELVAMTDVGILPPTHNDGDQSSAAIVAVGFPER